MRPSGSAPLARILFCTLNYAPGAVGGAEQQARLQAEELVRLGYQVTVVCPREPGTESGMVNGVEVRRLPVRWRGKLRRPTHILGLLAFLARNLHRYDLVHIHMAGLQTETVGPLTQLFRRPMYVKMAAGGRGGDMSNYRGTPSWLQGFGLKRASRVQAISDEIRGELLALGLPPERVVSIPNGIDTNRFSPPTAEEKAAARQRLQIPQDETVVLFVGRFHVVKGIRELLQVWDDPALAPDARLLLVGGTEWSQLRDTVKSAERIDAREWTPSIEDCYRAADVFVLPSHTEGMSNALLESMACGVPAVATRVGAAESMVTDGESALLIPPGDVPALSTALRRLVDDPALRGRIGAAARQRVEAYSISSVVARIAEQYQQLING